MFKYDKHLRLEDKRYAWDYLRTDSIDNFKYKKDLVLKNLKKISNLTNLKNIKLFIVIYPHPGTILFLENIEISKNNELISNFCNDTNNCNTTHNNNNMNNKDNIIHVHHDNNNNHM